MHVLHLEDSPLDAELLGRLMLTELPGLRITRVATRGDYEAALQKRDFDLIISDFLLPEYSGLAALDVAHRYCPEIPFIFLSGHIGEERAIEALRSGATDYVLKDRPARLPTAIRQALERAETERQRIRTEEALRVTKERYRQITENVADLITVLDLEGKRVYTNPAYRILGTPEQLLGTSSFANIHPEDRARIEALFHHTSQTGHGNRAEFRITLPDGSIRHVDSQSGAIRDADGIVTNVLVISRDFTEKKHAAEETERQHAFLRQVIDLDRNYIFAKDRHDRFILANQAVAARYNTTVDGLLGRTSIEFGAVPDTLGAFAREAQIARETQKPVHNPALIVMDEAAQPRFFDVLQVPLGPEHGHPDCILGFATDVTEQQQQEQQLRHQASLLDKARDAIAVTDLSHRVTYWNRSAERLYGYSSAEAMGQDLRTLLYGLETERFDAAKEILLATGEWRGELHPESIKNRPMTVESTWSLVTNADDQPSSILLIDTDVTDQRLLTLQLERAQRLESIGMLAGGIAHDLNNALAPIQMGAELLRMMIPDPAARTLLQTMETSARHGASLVRQVLAFARGAEGERGPLQVRHVLTEVEQFLQQTLERNITIRVRTERNLPPVLADATQLKQVLLNLAVNARDAMPQGGTLDISAETCIIDAATAALAGGPAQAGPHQRITVRDSGTGIPPETVQRIFDPFFTTKQPDKGTGLGLSLVHGIIKGHGGFVQVESQVGEGSAFHLFLPLQDVISPDHVTELPRTLAPGRGEEILVIDDDNGIRTVVESLLKTHGYRVQCFAEGAPALVELKRADTAVQVVITDLMMPGLSGIDLIDAIRSARPAVPVIAMSGLTKAIALPPEIPLIAKPLTASTLLGALQQVLKTTE